MQWIGQAGAVNGSTAKLRLIGVLMAVVLAGYAVGALLDQLRLPGVELDETPSLRALRADDAAPQSGSEGALVTVVVFTDYQCPFCRIDHRGLAAVAAS